MSTDDEQEQEAEQGQAEEAGESAGMSERAARVILVLVAVGAAWGLVAAFPDVAYVIVGAFLTLGWQKGRSWVARRRRESVDEAADAPAAEQLVTEEDVVQALRFLAAPHVFLSGLAAHLDLPMDATRAVLDEMNIKVRRAVRVGDTTGVGVHKDDIPPLPQPLSETPVEPVDQGQPTNQHAVRIERTDAGFVVYDLADTHRHHEINKP